MGLYASTKLVKSLAWLVIKPKRFYVFSLFVLCNLRSIIPHQSNHTSHKKIPKKASGFFVNGMSILFIDRHFWVDVNDLKSREWRSVGCTPMSSHSLGLWFLTIKTYDALNIYDTYHHNHIFRCAFENDIS